MSVPDNGRFDELVSLYLDATLKPVEEQELLQYLSEDAYANRFHEAARLHTEIAGILAGSLPDEVMVGLVWSDLVRGKNSSSSAVEPYIKMIPTAVRAKPGKSSRHLLALAAMLAGLLVISAVYFFRSSTVIGAETRAEVSSLQGEVCWASPSGQVPFKNGQSLKDGETIKTVGPDSRANLKLADGTQIELMGDTTLTAEPASEKHRLVLTQGMLRATVEKQPENAPLVFTTPNATATVRGTELALIADGQDTYLVVTKGAVALQRSSSGPEILVKAGYYGHVESAGIYHSWPIQRLPRRLFDQVFLDK